MEKQTLRHRHNPLDAFIQFVQAPLLRAIFVSLIAHSLLLTLPPPIFQTTGTSKHNPIALVTLTPKNITGNTTSDAPTAHPRGIENIPNHSLLAPSDNKIPEPPHAPAPLPLVTIPNLDNPAVASVVPSSVPSNNISSDQKSITTGADKRTHEESTPTVPAEGLGAYRLALGREAKRLQIEYERKYSQREGEWQKGQEGRVEMNIRIHPAGNTVALKRSSGHRDLDEQALELIERAVRQTPLPDSLLGRHLLVPVALDFEIARE